MYIKSLQEAISQEAVDFQIKPDFFIALSEKIKQVMEDKRKPSPTLMEEYGVGKVIQKHLGVKVIMQVAYDISPNAFVVIPDFNRNSVMTKRFSHLLSSKDGLSVLKGKDYDIGCVDRRNGKLSGVYAEIPVEITVTSALMTKDFTPEEIAAIILHEVGHVFSYYETLHHTLASNLAITTACEEIVGTKDPLYKVKVIKDLQNKKIISKDIDADKVAQMKDDKSVYSVLISDAQREVASRNDCPLYNQTMFEQSADQFAVRMGAGRHLATALNKLAPDVLVRFMMWGINLRFVFTIIFAPILILEGGFFAIMGGFYLIIAGLISWELYSSPYDKGKDRMTRIRRELIGLLKKSNLPKEALKRTLEDLEAISEEVEKQENRRSLGEQVIRLITQLTSQQSSKKSREQAIESLLYNELFVIGNQLKLQGK